MELPETEDRRYKIINKVYSPQQDADEQTERFDVGIASQTSINHLHNLVKLVEVWNGPISVGTCLFISHIFLTTTPFTTNI